MKYPSKLKDGATIGLVSPSSPIPAERVGLCRKVLEDMGFHVETVRQPCRFKRRIYGGR